ncbi:LacI family DNA-binding transcriptional regulator [Algoriphagus namhaensis]
MKIGQATIKDIAKELGVSSSTVSRALKDYPGISDETKRKVKEVADRLNYRPNAVALSLRKSRSFTIGVIIPEVVHFFFSTVISGIEEIAQSRGYNVILTQTNESLEREKSSIETMLSNQIDGFLVSFSKETQNFDHFTRLLDHGFPIVFFDRAPDLPKSISVLVDDYHGAYQATSHLIEQGYKRIAHLGGPHKLKISKNRERGYRDALYNHGMQVDESLIAECALGTSEEAFAVTEQMLRQKKAPDAFFASNDMAAVGAMLAAKKAGLKVPQDVGIVGFSNWQFCSMLEPTLTSVAQPGFKMGAEATTLLLDIIEKKIQYESIKDPVILKTELLVRNSSLKR